jgi:hypothetical protein
MASVDQTNGYEEGAEEVFVADRPLTLELSYYEAQALKGWLLSSTSDGTPAIEDEGVKPVLVKLGTALDVAEAVVSVRAELDRMGFQSDHLSDEEILEFRRRISAGSVQRV